MFRQRRGGGTKVSARLPADIRRCRTITNGHGDLLWLRALALARLVVRGE